ncbi:DUF2817 domain-containing protein [Dorea sp.]
MSIIETDLGAATAYAEAVEAGYKGTREEFGKLLANFVGSATEVEENRTAVEKIKEELENTVNVFDQHVSDKTDEANKEIKEATDDVKGKAIESVESARDEGKSAIAAAVEEGKKNFVTDKNLEEEGRAADAKAVGDVVGQLKEDLDEVIKEGISDNLIENLSETLMSNNPGVSRDVSDNKITVTCDNAITYGSASISDFKFRKGMIYVIGCDVVEVQNEAVPVMAIRDGQGIILEKISDGTLGTFEKRYVATGNESIISFFATMSHAAPKASATFANVHIREYELADARKKIDILDGRTKKLVNLFNKDDVEYGRRIAADGKTLEFDMNYVISNYIPCKESDVLRRWVDGTASFNGNYIWGYDSEKKRIGVLYCEPKTEKIRLHFDGSEATSLAYIRISVKVSDIETTMITVNEKMGDEYTPYKYSLKDAYDIIRNLHNVNNNIITIEVSENKYITTKNDSIDINEFVFDAGYVSAVSKCESGDRYLVSGASGDAPRLWAFADANGKCLARSDNNIAQNNISLVAPEGAAYAIFNAHNVKGEYSFEKKVDYSLSTQYIMNKIKRQEAKEDDSNNISEKYSYNFEYDEPEKIPVGDDALSYDDFIGRTWEVLRGQYPNEITREIICKDTSNTFNIYKYIFQPKFYKKTVFLCAGMHGDEYEGFWGLYRFMELLYNKSYKIDGLRRIRHDVRFVIIPALNPYGITHKQRYNSENADPNYNYDVRFSDSNYRHSGTVPFQYNEVKAVKTILEEYGKEIVLHCEFHTDPYQAEVGNYVECLSESILYKPLYNLTLDNRANLKEKYNFTATYSNVVYPTMGSNVFRYMEEVWNIPSAIIEASVGFFANSGTEKQMKSVVEWYVNAIIELIHLVT